jgi:hypothetical protein
MTVHGVHIAEIVQSEADWNELERTMRMKTSEQRSVLSSRKSTLYAVLTEPRILFIYSRTLTSKSAVNNKACPGYILRFI